MMIVLAILLPFLVLFILGKPFQGIFCLIFCLTGFGYPVSIFWAFYALSKHYTDKKIAEAVRINGVEERKMIK